MKTVIRNSYSPKSGDYCEKIVIDKETNKKYLFDCDGVWTLLDGSVDEEELLRKAAEYTDQEVVEEAGLRAAADDELRDAIDEEGDARAAADQEIWQEIEAIEAASDVVDIVGTYAELENYDTSALKDNDIIKVLQDETHDDAIAYYRWNASGDEFTFVGVEGPYYTASETDTLLAGKVNKTDVTSTPSFVPMLASETLVMSQKGVARQVLNADNGGIQISSTAGNAIAGGTPAIAIGPNAETGQSSATAIGYNAKALGGNGLALGYGSSASGAFSISLATEGSKAAGNRDIAIGNVSTEAAAGEAQTGYNLAIGSPEPAHADRKPKATGGNSTAIGHGAVTASGNGSTAIGYGGITAAGANDIALGSGGTSTAVFSGTQTVNNVAVGSNGTRANGGNAVAFGSNGVTASGQFSTAVGNAGTTASGLSSTAVGNNARATGARAAAFGTGASGAVTASGDDSMAMGTNLVTAAGANDIAIGGSGTTTKVSSGTQTTRNVSVGLSATANGGDSAAFGSNGIYATGKTSTAIGHNSITASGEFSTAIGASGAVASGYGATALGYYGVTASGEKSTAVGASSVTASGKNSAAFGADAVEASGDYNVAIGTNGVRAYDSFNMAIGIAGASAGNPSSATSSSYNFALGGQNVQAYGGYSVAIGTTGTRASAERTVALGHRYCTASHADSVALGTDAATGRTFEVSLGKNAVGSNPEVTKYIAHVTAGVNDTDAVNVSQLNAAIPGVMTGATSSAAGTTGLVPAPAAGDNTKFLSGDGTWKTVSSGATYTAGQNIQISSQNVISATDTTYGVFTTTTNGLVPACNEQWPSDMYLAGDGTWNPLNIRGTIEFYLPDGGQAQWREGTNASLIIDLGNAGAPNTYTLSTLTPGTYPNGVITYNGSRVYSGNMYALDVKSTVLEFPTDSSRTYYKILSSFSSSLTGHLSFIIQGVENGTPVTYLLDIADSSGAADVITKLAVPATNNISSTDWNALWQ